MLPAPLAAVLLLVALLPGGVRCQGGNGTLPPPPPLPPLPPSPPLPPLPSGDMLVARMNTVSRELAAQVQDKYGFCMANAEEDLAKTFNFTSNTSFLTDCMRQTQGHDTGFNQDTTSSNPMHRMRLCVSDCAPLNGEEFETYEFDSGLYWQMVNMLCTKAEIELYLSSLGSSRMGRISRNCNQSSWVVGCLPGWACLRPEGDTLEGDTLELEVVPSRAEKCMSCCPGFFCPRGLTCMMPCPLGAYCPLGTLNETTNLCDPYSYQITPGFNYTCGSADSWADVVTTNNIFCPPGHHCPTTTQKFNCSKGSFCRKGSTGENRCLWKSRCKDNSSKEDLSLFGGALIVVLSVVLLIIYNCSGQFIAIRAKMSSKSRKKAAKIAQKSAIARERWKLAKNFVLSHDVEMRESFDTPDDRTLLASEGTRKRSKNRKRLTNVRTERFRRAYSQIDKERALQLDNGISGVVSLASENRSLRPMFEVAFKGLTLSIGKKKLLQCVTGKLSPGRITAIMGPSGAGKTTFLNAVLGKTSGYKKDGSVLVNGKSGSMQLYKKIIGFVPQDDIVHGNLTVEENLWFSACCRLSRGMSKADKVLVLERVIGSLGLTEIRDSLVGTVEKRGISGGQRKRVNVGIEMVMEPSLLILDEPTTGLDSASSQQLLRALRHEALQGVNVCAVVHQPSYTLFNLFDDFVLLARGGLIAYHGPISEIENYFSGLGIKVPGRENPPDYYIDVLEGIVKTKMTGHFTPKHLPLLWIIHNGYEVPEDMKKELEEINASHELYTIGSITREQSSVEQPDTTDSVHQNVRQINGLLDRTTPGVLAQYKYYLGRVAKQRLREATQQAVDYLILCIAGICIGTITRVRDDSFGADSYGYTIIAVSLLCQLAALRSFSPERLQYWRERESGMSTLAYFLSRDTIDHFNTVVKPIAFLSTFYFFNNPRSTLQDNYFVLLALIYCVTGMGYCFAIWFELGLAQLCSALLPVVLVLAGIQAKLPKNIEFIRKFCYPKWALEAFIIAGAKEYSGVWLITRCGALLKGKYDINDFALCIAIMMLNGVLFRLVALYSLLKLK